MDTNYARLMCALPRSPDKAESADSLRTRLGFNARGAIDAARAKFGYDCIRNVRGKGFWLTHKGVRALERWKQERT